MDSMGILLSIFCFIVALLVVRYTRVIMVQELVLSSQFIFNSVFPAKLFIFLSLLPGVVVHELSHLLTAMFLGVRTGSISFFPEKMREEYKLGSVQVAKTDPIRSTLIGISPFIVGWIFLYFIVKDHFSFLYSINLLNITEKFHLFNSITQFLFLYLIYVLSNTIMLSKSDQRGFIPTGILLGILIFLGSFIEFPLLNMTGLNYQTSIITSSLAITAVIVAFINLCIALFLVGFNQLLSVLLGKRKLRLTFKS
jgi:hypothetical protein